jgi:valyl-tRNA synthetase
LVRPQTSCSLKRNLKRDVYKVRKALNKVLVEVVPVRSVYTNAHATRLKKACFFIPTSFKTAWTTQVYQNFIASGIINSDNIYIWSSCHRQLLRGFDYNNNMEKTYDHKKSERKTYELWEKSGAFTPKKINDKKPFTIIMPPPNANEDLHIGHARFITIEDILTRYNRMKGRPSLWLPGADHAGIETQYVFEKKLKEKGKSRFDYNRDTFYKMIWDYSMEKKTVMENQLKALGASCDWTRNKFTLDPDIVKVVYKTFKNLYDDSLIYRGERIVNYCPFCGTSFSQLEVNYVERDDSFYYLDYGKVTIATTRPETLFADVAVAISPKDKRYKKLVGKNAKLPLVGRDLPIIEDKLVDPKFGTGALKVTPGHDATDFEIGEKHSLARISVIDKDGKMINAPEKYIGMATEKARVEVVKDLKKKGFIKRIEKIHHIVGVCYKHKTPIEPMLSKQWFLEVNELSKRALNALKEKKVNIVAEKYEKIAKHWLRNLRDWNISRQIVWGIRIPAWRCQKCMEWIITDGEIPKVCPHCKNAKLKQDEDTFDTWFSSAQWPYATLKTTMPGDFEYFYPTSVMETAYDILAFWVLRMIMLGLYSTDNSPFEDVLLHGLVRDKNGEKISKSRGNVINPLDMTKKYGADAVRMSLIWGTLVENDIALSEDNIKGQRNFANKIWNVSRYVFMEKSGKKSNKNDDDKNILKQLKTTSKSVTKLIDKYRINEAAEVLYDFVWNKFANEYLEKSKTRRKDSQKTLEFVLQESLKLLHPFMPFVTEAVWQKEKERFDSPTLISASWPKY